MVIFCLLLLPVVGEAYTYFILRLKNGGRVVTSSYWVEERLIYFNYGGGIAGIEKKEIELIERQEKETGNYLGTASKTDRKEDQKKESDVMSQFTALEKKFESRKDMTVDELQDFKSELLSLRGKIVSAHSEAEFRKEDSKINDMKFFINDLLIIKERSR